jgi:hypothetical protein
MVHHNGVLASSPSKLLGFNGFPSHVFTALVTWPIQPALQLQLQLKAAVSKVHGNEAEGIYVHKLKLNYVALVRERTIPNDRLPLVGEVSANFSADKRCHVVDVTDSHGCVLGFLDRARYFSSKWLLNHTHNTEWTPFETHYF